MKRVKLDDTYVANVEEGTRSRLEKATRRGMDPVQVQALSNFATKIRNTIDEHRDDTITISTTPATPNSKKYEEELSKRVDVMGDLLSAIVSRVLKHRTDTPQIVESIKPPPKKPVPTNEPAAKIDNPQVDDIIQEMQDMLGNYAHTISTAKEELPLLLAKAERILQTLQTLASINSSPSATLTTIPKPSSQDSKPTTTSATNTNPPTTTSQPLPNPPSTTSNTSSSNTASTQSLLKQPSKVKKDSDTTETKSNGNAKPIVKSPNAKKASTTATPPKTNGKRKSVSSNITKDDVSSLDTTPRRSTRRKTEASQ